MNSQAAADALVPSFEAIGSDAGRLGFLLLEAQKESLEMVVRGAPLGQVLTYLTEVVEQHGEGQSVAVIRLVDAEGRLWTGAAPSLPAEYNGAIDGLKVSAELATCSAAAALGTAVVTPDIDADPKWQTLKHLPLGLGLKAVWSQPIIARDGRVIGTFGTYFRDCRAPSALERRLVEILSHTAALAIERKQSEESLARERRITDLALEAADMGTWRYFFADQVSELSPRAQLLYGIDGERFVEDEDSVRGIVHPDDVERRRAALRAAADPAGHGHYHIEYRVRRREGGWRWLSVWGIVEFDRDRRTAIALIGASRDITRRKEAERRQKLLVAELSHRVKNTLAIVQAIASQTLRETTDPAAFKAAFAARLAALGRAHTLLTDALWRGASLAHLAGTTLTPFARKHGADAIRIDGPPVEVTPNEAVTLCLVLHELATNAAKHGALSTPKGSVSLAWRVTAPPGQKAHVDLDWQERGGPTVTPPRHRGFGSRLIAASADQLQGEADMAFRAEGFAYRLRFPRPEPHPA